MCTVTYIPGKEGFSITSNRDEKSWRESALVPQFYAFDTGSVLFPKDPHAGGTWIATHENGNAIVFLNGAFEAHTPNPPYKKSRGVVLLDLINSHSPCNSFLSINLNNIEPFTAVIFDQGFLFECRWNGNKKFREQFDASRPYIWSSATLYDKPVRDKRQVWFETWIKEKNDPTLQEILHFHRFTGDGDHQNDLLMNRDGKVGTVSITSVQVQGPKITMHYLDLQNNQLHSQEFGCEKMLANS